MSILEPRAPAVTTERHDTRTTRARRRRAPPPRAPAELAGAN
eukprot:gene8377-16227_t